MASWKRCRIFPATRTTQSSRCRAFARAQHRAAAREHPKLAAKGDHHADGGTLYRVSDDQQSLHFEIVAADSLKIAFGGTSGKPLSAKFPDLPLTAPMANRTTSMVAAYSAPHAETVVNIADAYTAEGFDFPERAVRPEHCYRSQSFLTVPMKNHENEVIGVLQLINAKDDNGTVRAFPTATAGWPNRWPRRRPWRSPTAC